MMKKSEKATGELDAHVNTKQKVHVVKVIVDSIDHERQHDRVDKKRAQIDLEYVVELVAVLVLEAIVALGAWMSVD